MSAPRRALPWLALPRLAARPLLAAQPPAPPVDADLLEFRGTVDSEEPGWHDYLAGAGDLKGAKRPPQPPADAKPGTPAPSPSPPKGQSP